MYTEKIIKIEMSEMGLGKRTKILNFTWTGKMSIPGDCNKLCMYNLIPRAITKKS